MCNHEKEILLKDGRTLVLRNPKLGDEQGLIDHMKAVDCETKFLAREPGEFNFTLQQERSFIENVINDENTLFLLGEVDGKIMANCSVGRVNGNRRYLHRAAMGLSIRKEFWRNGIGRRMMEECII